MRGSFLDKDGNKIEVEIQNHFDDIEILDHIINFNKEDYDNVDSDVLYAMIDSSNINYKWFSNRLAYDPLKVSDIEGTEYFPLKGDTYFVKTNAILYNKKYKKEYPIYVRGFLSKFLELDLCICNKGYYCGPAGDAITANSIKNSSVLNWRYNDPGRGKYKFVSSKDKYVILFPDNANYQMYEGNNLDGQHTFCLADGSDLETTQFYIPTSGSDYNAGYGKLQYAADLNEYIKSDNYEIKVVDAPDADAYVCDFKKVKHSIMKNVNENNDWFLRKVDYYVNTPTNVTFRQSKQSGSLFKFTFNEYDELDFPRYAVHFGRDKYENIKEPYFPFDIQNDTTWKTKFKKENTFDVEPVNIDERKYGNLVVNIVNNDYNIPAYESITDKLSYYDMNHNKLKIGALNSNFKGSIAWGSDPITIEENIDDPFSPIITKSATIRLITSKYLGRLFYFDSPSTNVKISKNGNLIFVGGIEPYTYSQPFSNYIEEIEIHCIDILSMMQYYKYIDYKTIAYGNEIAESGIMMQNQHKYERAKTAITNVSFRRFLDLYLLGDYFDTPLFPHIDYDVWYDCSKQIDNKAIPELIFDQLSISQAYLYGDDYEDCMTVQDVMSNMLTYLNLHIKQEGDRFYIFDWDSLKGTQIAWYSFREGNKYNHRLPKNQLSVSKYAANDTNITLGEVYNQLILTCELDNSEEVIQSPMDEDTITSVWPAKQFYCREYLLESKNNKAAFTSLVRNQSVDKRDYTLTDWYIQVLYSKNWKFNTHDGDYLDRFEYDDTGNYINAANVLRYARNHHFTPVLLNVTKVSNPTKREDDGTPYEASRETQLYITINGNDYINGEINETKHPTDAEIETYNTPIVEYKSPKGGTVFSPTDDETTNYLVFSGKITLIPNTYYSIFNGIFNILDEEGIRMKMAYNNTWPSGLNYGGNCLYGRRFFDLKNPQDKPIFNSNIAEPNLILKDMHLSATDKDYKGEFFKYNWTASNQRDGDKIAKIPLLACELTIGHKRLIEYDMDQYGNSKFKWVTIGEEPLEYDKDDKRYYTNKTFSIGINPKIGDFIVGTEFDFQNTVTFDMNLGDEKGIAIPIKASDNLNGDLTFRILGVYNITWNDVIYRHGTWFRKKKWTDNYKELLPKLRSICISDFKCKIFSDNANLESLKDDSDLCYVSDEIISFNNVKDDLEFKFVTQPSSAECIEKGLKNAIYNNSVQVTQNNATKPLKTIFNAITHETAKPEEMYIDQYYKEFSVPRLNMSFTAHSTGAINFSQYYSKLLDKNFYIFNKSYNVLDNTYLVNLREI